GNVIWRVFGPPAAPGLVRPGTAHRSPHVPAENPGAEVGQACSGKVVVDTRRPPILAGHPLKGARRDDPIVQSLAADAKRFIEALLGTGTVPVERNREGINAESGHVFSPNCVTRRSGRAGRLSLSVLGGV